MSARESREIFNVDSTFIANKKNPFSYTWTIRNFSQQGGPLVSPPFIDQNGRRFNLQIFPKGDSQTCGDFLCICICPDKNLNVSQDSAGNPKYVGFLLSAISPNGDTYTLLDVERLLTKEEYFREAINLQTLQRKKLLVDDQLKLHFQFSSRSLSPSENHNGPPKKKQKHVVTQIQARSETNHDPRPDVVRSDLTWTISNFSQQEPPLVSPTFKDKKRRLFNLQVFPKGDGKTRDGFLCICICPDKNANAAQDSDLENRQKVRFIISAFKNGNPHPLLESESLLTTKKYFREAITMESLRQKGFLTDNRLKLHFQFCKLRNTKKKKKLSRIQIKNDPPRRKTNTQVATVNAISNVVTQPQARSETQSEPNKKNKPRYSLSWTIPNFSQQEGPLMSPMFNERKGRRFNLQIFPKGDSQTVEDFLSICICPDKGSNGRQDSEENLSEIQFILWASAANGGWRHIFACKSQFTEKESFRETISLQTLRRRSLLVDDQLKLHFRFFEPKKKKTQTLSQKPESSPLSRPTNLELYFSGRDSDVTIVVGGRSFFCHKRILAKRSLIFESTFDIAKDQDPIDIADLSATVFGHVLYYIYTEKVPFLDAGNARELLTASERFQLVQLKEACETFILKNLITTSTASEIHKLATASNSPNLYAKAMAILSKPEIELITID